MRQYVSAASFLRHRLGKSLGAASFDPGEVDEALANASARADSYCNRHFGVPGATTLTASASAGSNALALASSLGIDGTTHTLLQIGSGATQEIVQCGYLTLTEPLTNPYPGTVTLYPGATLAYSHNAGEQVQAFYYEQYNSIGSATTPLDQSFDLTQQGQIAAAHAPSWSMGQNARRVFLRNMPLLQILSVSIIYPWNNQLDPGVPSDLLIAHEQGWIRFPLGIFNPPDSVVTVAYSAGYGTAPSDVREAVMFETAAELGTAKSNAYGLASERVGDESRSFGARSLLTARAEELLCKWVVEM